MLGVRLSDKSQAYAGYLNDRRQARRVVLNGHEPNRRCRWCNSQLVRLPQGAVVCGGFCDIPEENTEGPYA